MSQQRCKRWREEVDQYNRWDFHFRRRRIRLLTTYYERESASIVKTVRGDKEMRVSCLGADSRLGLLSGVRETAAGLWSLDPLVMKASAAGLRAAAG